MLGNWLRRRRDRKDLDYSALTTADPTYGRLDGEDALEVEKALAHALELQSEEMCDGHWCLPPERCICPKDNLTEENKPPVNDEAILHTLEAQLDQALALLNEQNEMLTRSAQVTVAARALVELISSHHHKTGDALFKLNGVDDNDPLAQTLQFRFADLAAALNDVGRPVPPKLASGTVH
jgi:hypothetical protein